VVFRQVTIYPDVRGIAQSFNLDPQLVQAVCNAEGDIVKAVRCSVPSVKTREEAIRILCRSIVHAMRDYIVDNGHADEFIAQWAQKWAPEKATNDPTHLNHNWPKNVTALWGVTHI
jgi:hypothetical protein